MLNMECSHARTNIDAQNAKANDFVLRQPKETRYIAEKSFGSF